MGASADSGGEFRRRQNAKRIMQSDLCSPVPSISEGFSGDRLGLGGETLECSNSFQYAAGSFSLMVMRFLSMLI